MSPKKAENPAFQAVWEIETTHPDLVPKIDATFDFVKDPEIGMSVIELGLIRDVKIDDENKKAHIDMIMTTPFCPYAPKLLEDTRSALESVLGYATTIEMGIQVWDKDYMEEGSADEWGLWF